MVLMQSLRYPVFPLFYVLLQACKLDHFALCYMSNNACLQCGSNKQATHLMIHYLQVITYHFLDLCLQQDGKISYRMDQ